MRRQRQCTRSPVSRSSARRAFEDKGRTKGVGRAPRCRAEAHLRLQDLAGSPHPGQLRGGGGGNRSSEKPASTVKAGAPQAGREGSEPSRSSANSRATPGQLAVQSPHPATGRDHSCAGRSGAAVSIPSPFLRAPALTGNSPGATSGKLTAPPTKTAAVRTADPGSPREAIARSLRPPPRPGPPRPELWQTTQLWRWREDRVVKLCPSARQPRPAANPTPPRTLPYSPTHLGSAPPLGAKPRAPPDFAKGPRGPAPGPPTPAWPRPPSPPAFFSSPGTASTAGIGPGPRPSFPAHTGPAPPLLDERLPFRVWLHRLLGVLPRGGSTVGLSTLALVPNGRGNRKATGQEALCADMPASAWALSFFSSAIAFRLALPAVTGPRGALRWLDVKFHCLKIERRQII